MIRITILILHCVCSEALKNCPSPNPTINLRSSLNICTSDCPDNFVKNADNTLCYGTLPEASFNETQCILEYDGPMPCQPEKPVWYPAKRNLDYGIGEFMRSYYTKRGETVEIDKWNQNEIMESNCVIKDNGHLVAVPCESKYSRICVHKLHWWQNWCDLTDFACFATYNYSELMCSRSEGHFEVCNTAADYKDIQKVCKSALDYDFPKISLERGGDNKIYVRLTAIYNLAQIDSNNIFCYTDHFKYKLIGFHLQELTYESFELSISETGSYWCSGFDIIYFQESISNKLSFVFNNLYVIEVTFDYLQEENPTSRKIAYSKYIKLIQTKYNELHNYKARGPTAEITTKWMKTLWVDEQAKKVTYLVHICTNKDHVQHIAEYDQINETLFNKILPSIEGFSNASELYTYQYCIKTSTKINGTILTWDTTNKSSEATSNESYNGKNITRKCMEDFYNGARWESISDNITSDTNGTSNTNDTSNTNNTSEILPDVTTELKNLLDSTNNTGETIEGLFNITQNTSGFTPEDMFLISSILLKLNPNECDVGNVSEILSNIMISDIETLQKSQNELNATDRILDSYDRILEIQKHNHSNEIIPSTYLYTYIFDGTSEDVGFGVIKSENYEAIRINRSMGIEDIASIPNLEAATWIPNDILEILDQDSKITITIHLTSSLFNDEEQIKINGKNFGILLPRNIKRHYEIPILFKPSTQSPNQCGFWSYGYQLKGSWKIENPPKILPNNIQVCYFPHVTHFGLMVLKNLELNDKYLDLITNILTGFSMLGFFGIFLTAALFKTWRKNRGNQILINYSIISFIQLALLYTSSIIEKISNDSFCEIIGASLHYTLLSQFFWMLVIAFLQYKRYVQVLHVHQRCLLIKVYLTSYILPAIPVITLFLTFKDNYNNSKVGLCFPSGDALYYCVLLPIALVVLTNFVIFCRISLEMFCIRKNKCIDDDMFLLRLRLVVLMYFMLGVTWGFGLAANILNNKLAFYIFCITGSLQGFVIFLFFVVFNENSRLMYIYMWKKYSC